MKVCIIGHTERNYLPYMEKYVRFFEQNGVTCDIICWQREEIPSEIPADDLNFYEAEQQGKFSKIFSYLRFKKHVNRIIRQNRYDKLIVLTTVPAVFLRKTLLHEYRGRYLLDIRDYSFENRKMYRNIVDNLIENSEFTTISSKGFLEFLNPNPKILLNHNIVFSSEMKEAADLKDKPVIHIGFIGGIRYFPENTALISALKNNPHYHLWYIGQPHPDCDLPGFCQQNAVQNVTFCGKYDNTKKPKLYENIDMVNSIYGSGSLEVTTALPNRLYEACLFKKPIISSKGTYLGNIIERYDLGVAVDTTRDDLKKILDEYSKSFDANRFQAGCEHFLNDVQKDENTLYQALSKFISD